MDQQDLVKKFLAEGKLDQLRKRFASDKGKSQTAKILASILPDLYSVSGEYVASIVKTYFADRPATRQLLDSRLAENDRERCIIALLAGQGAQYPLSLHIYLAMMLGVTPHEVAHILLLAGVYTGVNRFADGIFVHIRTLAALSRLK